MFNIGHKGELISLWCSCSCGQHSPWGEKAAHLSWKGKPAPGTEKTAVTRWARGVCPLPNHWAESPTSSRFPANVEQPLWGRVIREGGTPMWDCHQEKVSLTIRLWRETLFRCNRIMGIWLLFVSLPLLWGQICYRGKSFHLPSFHFLSLNQCNDPPRI